VGEREEEELKDKVGEDKRGKKKKKKIQGCFFISFV
jgi:hypothetical protein